MKFVREIFQVYKIVNQLEMTRMNVSIQHISGA